MDPKSVTGPVLAAHLAGQTRVVPGENSAFGEERSKHFLGSFFNMVARLNVPSRFEILLVVPVISPALPSDPASLGLYNARL